MKLASLAAVSFVVLGTAMALAQTATNPDGTPRQRPASTDASKAGKSTTTTKSPATTPAPAAAAPKPTATPAAAPAKPAPPPVTAKPIVQSQPPHTTWKGDDHPYAKHRHNECQEKAFRLHNYERRAAEDGRITRSERATIRSLQHDLDRSCGRFRWNR